MKKNNRKWFRKWLRNIGSGPVALSVISFLGVWYLRFVNSTNRYITEPPDAKARFLPMQPFIVSVWHGQHILLPVIPIGFNGKAMISRSFDGEVIARVVEKFGNGVIRASGGRKQEETLRKGGISGFLEMLRTIEEGSNVIQTADIPRGIARKAGLGIVNLAQRSGVPIVPLAIASSRRFVFQRAWDRASLNLPFGKTVICVGEPIHVSSDANDEELETIREKLQVEMDQITERAYELTGKPE